MPKITRYVPYILKHLLEVAPPPGMVRHIEIRHDLWCGIFRGLECNCEPIIETGDRINRKYEVDR